MARIDSGSHEQTSSNKHPNGTGPPSQGADEITDDKQKPTIQTEHLDIFLDHFPASPDPNTKTNEMAYTFINCSTLSLAYQDLAGQFPYKSTQGNQYILVGYHYNANCNLAQLVKTGLQLSYRGMADPTQQVQ